MAEAARERGRWQHSLADGRVQCDLCPRYCRAHEGQRAFFVLRERVGDEIVLTSYGKASGFRIDPIEKKPLNHFLPGTSVLSFGTAGCNLACKFCFAPSTLIATTDGVRRIADLFDSCEEKIFVDEGKIGLPDSLTVWART